jgi:site-specific recombinase XerD
LNYLDEFKTDCRLRGLSHQTIKTYEVYLTPFIQFAENGNPQTGLYDYLQRYANDRTKATALRHIRAYVRWCAAQGLAADWISSKHFRFSPAPQEQVLSIEEFGRILSAIPATARGRRDRAILTVLFYTGARRDAIRKLKKTDINLKDRILKVRTKGRKEQYLTLPTEAARVLNAWFAYNRKMDTPWAFPSLTHPDRPIDASSVTHCLPRYAEAARFERRVYIHLLRHSYATIMLENDVPVDVIQAALGHSNITTTIKYLHRLGDAVKVRRAMDRVFG